MTDWMHNLASWSRLFSPYARRSRLTPALLVVLPIPIMLMVWLPALQSALGGLATLAVSFGILSLLSEIARDQGKKKESELYRVWEGKPSVALLRANDTRIDPVTKARYRQFLARRMPGLSFPSAEEAARTPEAEETACEAVTAWLLTQTRDTKRFSLLFQENISYGFRRNLWGLRRVGIVTSLGSAAVSTAAMVLQFWVWQQSPRAESILVTLVAWLFAGWWVMRVNPDWVRVPADAFGRQLLAACDTL